MALTDDNILILHGCTTFPPVGQTAIVVETGDGQKFAYFARAYSKGSFVGKTGRCKSRESAIEAAHALLGKVRS